MGNCCKHALVRPMSLIKLQERVPECSMRYCSNNSQSVFMKRIFLASTGLILTLITAGQSTTDGYDLLARYNDSLLIYKTFTGEVSLLQAADNRELWIAKQTHDAYLTADAFSRLKAFNKEEYRFIDEFTKEAFGEAHSYPAPTMIFTIRRYTFLDKQTRFITGKDGKTKIPYLLRITFEKGKV